MRLHWGNYFITVGTRNVVVGPKRPYRGWADFRENALEVFRLVLGNSFIEAIERYSIKYANIIPAEEITEQNAVLDWDVRIGPMRLNSQVTQLRTEVRDESYLTIIQMSTSVVVEMLEPKSVKTGSLVDVDTLCQTSREDISQFSIELPVLLDKIRHHNKIMFFDCLRESTIAAMGPDYE